MLAGVCVACVMSPGVSIKTICFGSFHRDTIPCALKMSSFNTIFPLVFFKKKEGKI